MTGTSEKPNRETQDSYLEKLAGLPQIFRPVVSPDGRKVGFYWDKTGRNQIYVMNLETDEVSRVSDGEVPEDAHLWFEWKGNDTIYFHKDEEGNEQYDVYSINIEGDEVERVISNESQIRLQDISKDGRYVLYASDKAEQMNLYVYDTQEEKKKQITDYDQPVRQASISPDGKKIAYATNESEDLENQDVYVSKIDGTEMRNLEVGGEGYEALFGGWSSDSDKLLMRDDTPDKMRCGVCDLRNEEIEWFESDYDEDPVVFTPSDDGFVAVRMQEGDKKLVEYSIEDKREYEITEEGVVELWSIGPKTRCTYDGRLIFAHSNSDKRKEVLGYDFETGETETLVEAGYGDFDRDDFVEAEYVTYESHDSLEIGGLLYRPETRVGDGVGDTSADTDVKHPAIVMVHGGPHVQWVTRFNEMDQFLVERGYVVFKPNYRGSLGRGREFKNMIHGDWGGDEAGDIAEAGKWLKDKGWIDDERVAVWGGSYGGYSVYTQMVKYPELWTVGVASLGITDLHKLYEESMSHFKSMLEEQMGDPEENHELWRERSPIEHVENIERPILILHGANDPRCPVSQARIFKNALEEMGWDEGVDGEFEYVEFGEEGHGSTEMDHKIENFKLIDDFLERRM